MLAFIPIILTALTWGIASAGSVKWMAVGSETVFILRGSGQSLDPSQKYWTPIINQLSTTVQNLHIPLVELFICDSRFVFTCPGDGADTQDFMTLVAPVDELPFPAGSVAEIASDGSFIRWVGDDIELVNTPDNRWPRGVRKQFVFLFPTRPTSIMLAYTGSGRYLSRGFSTSASLGGSAFRDSYAMDLNEYKIDAFPTLVPFFGSSASTDSWAAEMETMHGFYALYFWVNRTLNSGSFANPTSLTIRVSDSSWTSGLSEKFGYVGNALDHQYEIEQSTDASGGVVMSGEIQVPVTLGRSTEQDICVGLRTVWDNEENATRVMGFGNGSPAVITNGDNFPIVTVGGAWRVSIWKTDDDAKRLNIPVGVDKALIVLQMDDSTDPITMSAAVYPYDYDHSTLGDGSADNPRCTLGNTADAYTSLIWEYNLRDNNPGFNANTKFTGEMVNLGRSARNINYPSPIVWSQLTINRVNADDGLNLYPWILDCSKPNCGAPDTVAHFRPYGFSPDDSWYPFAYIEVDDWSLHATGGDVPPLASDAASSGGAVTDVSADDDFGIPEDGVSRKLPGGNFIDEISNSVGVPYYFIWTLIGFGLAIVIIAIVQTFFNNILLSVVAGGVVLAVIATPTVGIGAIWVLLFYAVVGACVVIVGQRTSVGY